jgi:heat shock protein HtpX
MDHEAENDRQTAKLTGGVACQNGGTSGQGSRYRHAGSWYFPAPQANAFATGWNKNKALVAVSEGMLQRFTKDEVEAVMGHEVGHVANGDMITLALIQGVINTFVMFLARVVGFTVDRVVFKNEQGFGIGYFITTIVTEILLASLHP